MRTPKTRHVYIVRVGRYIKVGCSSSVKKRLTQIKRDSTMKPSDLDHAAPMELLCVVEDADFDTELDIHCDLSDYNAAGEWFRDCAEVRAYLAAGYPRERGDFRRLKRREAQRRGREFLRSLA